MFIKIKTACNFICKKVKNMSKRQWIMFALWMLTFNLLLTFVIVAAVMTKDSTIIKSVEAGMLKKVVGEDAEAAIKAARKTLEAADSVKLTSSIVAGKPGLFDISYPKFNIMGAVHYANALASLGTIFALGLFGSLFTTVWFAYKDRKDNK